MFCGYQFGHIDIFLYIYARSFAPTLQTRKTYTQNSVVPHLHTILGAPLLIVINCTMPYSTSLTYVFPGDCAIYHNNPMLLINIPMVANDGGRI